MNHDPPKTLLSTLANGVVVVMEIKSLNLDGTVDEIAEQSIQQQQQLEHAQSLSFADYVAQYR